MPVVCATARLSGSTELTEGLPKSARKRCKKRVPLLSDSAGHRANCALEPIRNPD